jgi:hypothetical protein
LGVGVVGLCLSLTQVVIQLRPRQFSPAQQQQIMSWEIGARWREMPADAIFPASAGYSAPPALQDGDALQLTSRLVGIAPQASCAGAADKAAAAVLAGNGCQAMLRATYVDGTGSYLATVGIAAFSSAARAGAAQGGLLRLQTADKGTIGAPVPGVRAVGFGGTVAAGFSDQFRQLSGSVQAASYVAAWTVGYADDRPWVPVSADSYADAEMTSMGAGLAKTVLSSLTARPPLPHCPGVPGC